MQWGVTVRARWLGCARFLLCACISGKGFLLSLPNVCLLGLCARNDVVFRRRRRRRLEMGKQRENFAIERAIVRQRYRKRQPASQPRRMSVSKPEQRVREPASRQTSKQTGRRANMQSGKNNYWPRLQVGVY